MSEPKSLSELIDLEIRTSGPMSLAAFMRLCLTHPRFGYYMTRDPLGAAGDFITAPEISQMFGEFIGMWIANCWQSIGAPDRFTLLELGPGRGTLMEDAMRVVARVPGLAEAKNLYLLETNAAFVAEQRKKLLPHNPQWISEIEEIDGAKGPLIVIANEFFDALPIRQYQKHNDKWHERAIGLKDGKRAWGLAPTPFPEDSLPAEIRDAGEGEVWEAGLVGLQAMHDLAGRIAARGGVMLAIDYGYGETRTGETFQAVSQHKFADPLADPGNADLTAHVDFAALSRTAASAGAKAWPLLTQGDFLQVMGIADRTKALATANPALARDIVTAAERLTSDQQMGALFKCLCISDVKTQPYPFAPTASQS